MRRLIVNADDFGLTPGVNRAILEAHGHGIVTSTTLMANAHAFQEAARRAHSTPGLSIGCHVVLIDGVPLLKGSDVSTLVTSRRQSEPCFRVGLVGFAARALRGAFDSRQIEAEATAQFRRLQAAGLSLTHFDTHRHTHMFPAVLQPLLRAAVTCGIRALRNPFAPARPLPRGQLLRRAALWKRYLEVRLLRTLAGTFRRLVSDAGMITPDGSFGIVATGALDEKLFAAIAGCIPEGTWEFVCHPGYNDEPLASVKTRLRSSRAIELNLLTSAAAKAILAEQGVELISYRDLLAGPTACGEPRKS